MRPDRRINNIAHPVTWAVVRGAPSFELPLLSLPPELPSSKPLLISRRAPLELPPEPPPEPLVLPRAPTQNSGNINFRIASLALLPRCVTCRCVPASHAVACCGPGGIRGSVACRSAAHQVACRARHRAMGGRHRPTSGRHSGDPADDPRGPRDRHVRRVRPSMLTDEPAAILWTRLWTRNIPALRHTHVDTSTTHHVHAASRPRDPDRDEWVKPRDPLTPACDALCPTTLVTSRVPVTSRGSR